MFGPSPPDALEVTTASTSASFSHLCGIGIFHPMLTVLGEIPAATSPVLNLCAVNLQSLIKRGFYRVPLLSARSRFILLLAHRGAETELGCFAAGAGHDTTETFRFGD